MSDDLPSGGDRAVRILIVDDERQNRDLLVRLLSREGYGTLTASNGEEALSLVAEAPPDLVLLDVQMPGISGMEVCRRLKEDSATRLTPVVLVTGLRDREHRIQGILVGADDFVSKPFDFEELRARVRSLLRLKRYTDELDTAESIIISLALTIEARDAYTEGHCVRLANYATALGERVDLSRDELAALHRGAYLHDLGKVGIPDALLLKPAPLVPEEYEVMKQHTVIGDRLCGNLRSLKLVRLIVRHHHERLDGSGYPDRLRGDAVPLLAQIVSIADAYDAITTDRPYRAAQPPEAAFRELRAEVQRGWRRADLVEAFVALGHDGVLARLAVGSRGHHGPAG
jgi:cyclic di-GMP phosphodiesterase